MIQKHVFRSQKHSIDKINEVSKHLPLHYRSYDRNLEVEVHLVVVPEWRTIQKLGMGVLKPHRFRAIEYQDPTNLPNADRMVPMLSTIVMKTILCKVKNAIVKFEGG